MSDRVAILERATSALRQAKEIFEKGNPDDGRLKFERVRALDILDSCNHAGVPPPVELVELFSLVMGFPGEPHKRMKALVDFGVEKIFGVAPHNRAALDVCIQREARAPADPTDSKPSTLRIGTLAEFSGIGERTLRRWRETAAYRGAVADLRQARQAKAERLRGERAATKINLMSDTG